MEERKARKGNERKEEREGGKQKKRVSK